MITIDSAKASTLQKTAAKGQIEAERDAQLALGVMWNGKRWQTNAAFQAHITGIIGAYNAGILPSNATTDIRTQDNEVVPLDLTGLKVLAGTVLQYVQGVFAESWAKKDAL